MGWVEQSDSFIVDDARGLEHSGALDAEENVVLSVRPEREVRHGGGGVLLLLLLLGANARARLLLLWMWMHCYCGVFHLLGCGVVMENGWDSKVKECMIWLSAVIKVMSTYI